MRKFNYRKVAGILFFTATIINIFTAVYSGNETKNVTFLRGVASFVTCGAFIIFLSGWFIGKRKIEI